MGDYTLYVPVVRSPLLRRERDALGQEARYFLAAFLGGFAFFFGVNGVGGVWSKRFRTSSVLRWSSSSGLGFSSLIATGA